MLTNFLHFLQNKPEKEKIKILWAVSAVTAVFVFMIWVSSFDGYKAAFNNSIDNAAKGMDNIKASVSEPVQQAGKTSEQADTPAVVNSETKKSSITNTENPNGVGAAENEIEESSVEEAEPVLEQNNTVKIPRLPVD